MLNERVRSVGFGEPLAISEAHLPLLAFVARKRGELRETSDIMRISSLLNGRRGLSTLVQPLVVNIANTTSCCTTGINIEAKVARTVRLQYYCDVQQRKSQRISKRHKQRVFTKAFYSWDGSLMIRSSRAIAISQIASDIFAI
ncbi:hypothetical protein ALC53_02664 [Atta colombica]|uniref:Uncharacterized protein n=1 Tax=Atta colombica TaxID=520822 RepID=A0A195BQM7_9HYME|nr:hypothetical protein ALC53_02664 [Atta colombica]